MWSNQGGWTSGGWGRAVASGGGGAWTPASLGSALAAWYDASDSASITQSGGFVSQINDKSGNARHAVQATGAAQPAYATAARNSLNVLRLDEDYIESSCAAGVFSGGFTFSAAWIKTGAGTSFNSGPITRTAGSKPAPLDSRGTTRIAGDGVGFDTWSAAPDLAGYTSMNVLVQSLTSGLVYNEWKDGNTPATNTFSTAFGDTSTVLTIGTRGDYFTTMRGDIGEIVAATLLNTTDRQKLEGYLAWKWGTVASLPAGHPYKSAAP